MIIELFYGFGLGILYVCFIAWFDTLIFAKREKRTFKSYLIATAWETMFLVAGIIIGSKFF